MTRKEFEELKSSLIERAMKEKMVFGLPNDVRYPDEAECLEPLDDDYGKFLRELEASMCKAPY